MHMRTSSELRCGSQRGAFSDTVSLPTTWIMVCPHVLRTSCPIPVTTPQCSEVVACPVTQAVSPAQVNGRSPALEHLVFPCLIAHLQCRAPHPNQGLRTPESPHFVRLLLQLRVKLLPYGHCLTKPELPALPHTCW